VRMERRRIERQPGSRRITFLSWGDLRPGFITGVVRHWQAKLPLGPSRASGHDAQTRLTRGVAGKTVAETFPTLVFDGQAGNKRQLRHIKLRPVA
jgi:hypothetical protein